LKRESGDLCKEGARLLEGEKGISIVIPAWNEADRIGATLERYVAALEDLRTLFEVIVVIDGVRDGTEGVVDGFANRRVRKLVFGHKLGKGGAVMEGLRAARFDYVGYVDADGAVPPKELRKMIGFLDDCDCVVASRWVHGSRVLVQEPLFNVVAGRAYNFLVRSVLFLRVRDTQCGAKFLRRGVLDRILSTIAVTNRAFEVSLLYHVRKSGGRIEEVPVEWVHDTSSRMPIGRAIPIMLLTLIGLRVVNSPVGKYVPGSVLTVFSRIWGTV
jgi:glycosyltransferase involved in cell wall biosynthesis